ncbi:acyl-CoA N-acyltransferase [Xylariaceae sp. AK1471]|nr:acyl-CoA N-acyltransferase [Xylariaceae sp. AK1471]
MDIYRSKRLVYIPIEKNQQYDDFFYKLMKEPGALNFDTSLPVGVSRANVEAVTAVVASRRLMCMYVCLPVPVYGLEEPRPIGIVSLSKPEERQTQNGNSSLSLMIASEYQRQGYGKEATHWALGWAFDYARLHRVEVSCYDWNPGAIRMYKSLGFLEEGVKREAVWFVGAWRDIHELAILEPEWRIDPNHGTSLGSEALASMMLSK